MDIVLVPNHLEQFLLEIATCIIQWCNFCLHSKYYDNMYCMYMYYMYYMYYMSLKIL